MSMNYEGRYGVEDTRQAVTEAKLQGIFPFCLTIDRQAASYLPSVFGAHQYALLTQPAIAVALGWLAFGETLVPVDFLGMAMVAAALALARSTEG